MSRTRDVARALLPTVLDGNVWSQSFQVAHTLLDESMLRNAGKTELLTD